MEVGWTPGSAEANRTYPEPSDNPSVHEIRAARSGGTSPVIADNYATHKHPAVTRWLDRHTRFHMHYTPTSSSWMNLVERFFRDLTEFITEKGFASTRELADAVIAFLAERNKNPRRYVWKAKGEDILRKINAARQALAARQPQGNAISKTAHQLCLFLIS